MSRSKKIIIIILCLLVVAVVVFWIIKKNNRDESNKYIGIGNELERVGASVEMIYYCEKSSIRIDDEVKDDLREMTNIIFEGYQQRNKDDLRATDIAKLILLESYFDIDSKLDLVTELKRRFIEGDNVFVYDPSLNDDTYKADAEDVSESYFVWRYLKIADDLKENEWYNNTFPVEQGLIDWFVLTTSDKTIVNHPDEETQANWITLVTSIPSIENNYKSSIDAFLDGLLPESDDESLAADQLSLENVCDEVDNCKLRRILKKNSDNGKKASEMFSSLNSEEAFGFDATDYSTFSLMSGQFFFICEEFGSLPKNEYFENNINKWLKQNNAEYINPAKKE